MAARTFAAARSSMSGAMSMAVTAVRKRREISIAVLPTPQPTSRTRAGLEAGLLYQSISCRPAAGVNDALAQHGKERIWIELVDLRTTERARTIGDLSNAHRC